MTTTAHHRLSPFSGPGRFPSPGPLYFLVLAGIAGCGGGAAAVTTDMGATPDLAPPFAASVVCTDTLDAVYTVPANLPAYDASHRGDVVRCGYDRTIAAADLNALITTLGYPGPAVPNGVKVYRIAYRTERAADAMGKVVDALASALVFIPDNSTPGVLVVTAHGSVGLGSQCAPSQNDLTKSDKNFKDDTRALNLELAGAGYTVIGPDMAGFGYGATVHGWSDSADEAHSLLDATRAMKKLLPAAAKPRQVALVGHSAGGHAVLSAQALAGVYGLEGTLAAVGAFAPLWIPPRSWAAAASPLAMVNTKNAPGVVLYALTYFYGHGELLDGPGGGLAVIQPAKRAAVKALVAATCLDEAFNMIDTIDSDPSMIFDATFVNEVATTCAIGGSCDSASSIKWLQRWRDDRPTVDPAGAPIVIWQGAKDATVTPDRAQCGFDRLQSNLNSAPSHLTLCGDPEGDHGSVVRRDMPWMSKWLAARLTGTPDPAACAAPPMQTCPGLPPNKD